MPALSSMGRFVFQVVAVALVAILVLEVPVWACTSVFAYRDDSMIFGKNYDWAMGHGYVIVNKRNVAKRALTLDRKSRPAEWVSKYGSVTFNQYGREFPLGGMNEAGLVVEIMWLDEARTPKRDARPMVNELQWIQYQLDSHSTVEEVVQSLKRVRISAVYAPVHYMTCDLSGACATIEYLKGKPVVHTGSRLPFSVLANDTYAKSYRSLGKWTVFGGEEVLPKKDDSKIRFARAAYWLRKLLRGQDDTISGTFDILKRVRSGGREPTQWSIVYDLKAREIHFQTRGQRAYKSISFEGLSFSCRDQVQMIHVKTLKQGSLNSVLLPYRISDNRSMIQKSLEPVKDHIPAHAIEILAQYPDLLSCQE